MCLSVDYSLITYLHILFMNLLKAYLFPFHFTLLYILLYLLYIYLAFNHNITKLPVPIAYLPIDTYDLCMFENEHPPLPMFSPPSPSWLALTLKVSALRKLSKLRLKILRSTFLTKWIYIFFLVNTVHTLYSSHVHILPFFKEVIQSF